MSADNSARNALADHIEDIIFDEPNTVANLAAHLISKGWRSPEHVEDVKAEALEEFADSVKDMSSSYLNKHVLSRQIVRKRLHQRAAEYRKAKP